MSGPLNPYQPPADESNAPPLVAELVVDDSSITLDYEVTIDDLVAWNLHRLNSSPSQRRQFFRTWFLIGFLLLALTIIFPQVLLNGAPGLAVSGMAGVLLLALWLLFPKYYWWRVRRAIQSMLSEGANLNLVGRRRVSLLPEYLACSTPISQSLTRWSGVHGVDRQPGGLYIQLSPVQAIVIPRRAFQDEAQFEKFARTAADLQAGAASRGWSLT